MTSDPSRPGDALSAEEYRALVGKGKRNKYNVAPASERTYQGVVYDSKLERDIAEVLDQAQHAKPPLVADVIRQWPVLLPGDIVYRADFYVVLWSGYRMLVEAKGAETAVWRLKLRLLKATYPDTPLAVVKSPQEALAALQDAQRGEGGQAQ